MAEPMRLDNLRRSLTGAWIETNIAAGSGFPTPVAPSRERGLKPAYQTDKNKAIYVAPSRERGLKQQKQREAAEAARVAPSRERGLKRPLREDNRAVDKVAPSRERGLKQPMRFRWSCRVPSRSLTGAWIETPISRTRAPATMSLPHGSVD